MNVLKHINLVSESNAITKKILELKEKYNTPLYVYDENTIVNNVGELQHIVSAAATIAYSVKANPNAEVISLMSGLVSYADVSSVGEIKKCMSNGWESGRLIYVGPYKPMNDLELAVNLGLRIVVVESLDEIERIGEICNRLHKTCSVAIRINPDIKVGKQGLSMSGVASQFGIDIGLVSGAIEKISQYKNIKLEGFHIYLGTRILDSNILVDNTKEILNLIAGLSEEYKFDLSFVDVGGGFGVPIYEGEEKLDTGLLQEGLRDALESFRRRVQGNIEIIFESGRFLVASSGYFVTTVDLVKESKGKKFAIVDGGTNNFSAPVFLSSPFRKNHMAFIANKFGADCDTKVTICGPLCSPTDRLLTDYDLPEVECNDTLVICNAGAYGYSFSKHGFLSHAIPEEIMMHKSHIGEQYVEDMKPENSNLEEIVTVC